MARLRKRVEPSGRQRQGIETKGVGGVSFGLRDRLAARPYLRRVSRRGGGGANLAVTVDYRHPHPGAVKEPSGVAAFLLRQDEQFLQPIFTRQILASALVITRL